MKKILLLTMGFIFSFGVVLEQKGDINISSIKNSAKKVTIKGDNFNEKLNIIISPVISEEKKVISTIETDYSLNLIEIKDDIAYLFDDFTLTLVDINNSEKPTKIATTTTPNKLSDIITS